MNEQERILRLLLTDPEAARAFLVGLALLAAGAEFTRLPRPRRTA